MFIFFALLFIAEWFAVIVLVVVFGALGFAEMARADSSPKNAGSPIADQSSARMMRWHVVAAILVIGNGLVISYTLACTIADSNACWDVGGRTASSLQYAFSEVVLLLLTIPALFGPMYAVRLHRHGIRAAELIGLGLVLLPFNLYAVPSLFDTGTAPDSLLVVAIAGLVLFALGAALPRHWVKTLVLSTSCVAMLIALSDAVGPANPVWLLAAIAMGYTIFRAEWKHLESAPSATVRVFAPPESQNTVANEARTAWSDTTKRIVMWIAINVACLVGLWLAWRIGFGSAGSAPATVYALVALAIAAIGAVATVLLPMLFGRARLDIDHGTATFVFVLVAAVVMHLIAVPPVEKDSYIASSGAVQLWKPVLGVFACVGAFGITVTTLTGRERQIRPFMMGIILPAAILLPSDSLFVSLREDSFIVWTQRLLETGLTATILAIMWYVFGPGRRTVSNPMGAVPQFEHEPSASTDSIRFESTGNAVTDAR